MKIYVNGRFRSHKITGQQRYAHEITLRLGDRVEVCEPASALRGWKGHLWEQTLLPLKSKHGLLWSPCGAGPARAANHIVTFHDLFALDSPEWYSRAFLEWYKVLLPSLAKHSSHIIAVSEYTKQRLVERLDVDPAKVTVIHNGVDAQFFRTGDDDAAASAHALGLPSRRYLLCVGSVEPRKNLVRLIAAWGEILHEMPEDLWLVVAGSGDSRVYQKTGLSTLPPRVFFTGYVPDASLPGLYRGGVGFIYPSIAEGFGLPALEAMASGVPVLTSSTSSLPEVCSTAAIYSDPLSVSDLARSIKLLVSDQELQFKLRFAGRERASQFTWERAANQTLNLLSEFAHSAALPQQAKAA